MRFLFFTFMMGAFALLPVAGQESETEASAVSWESFLRESAGLEARLGLGVASAVETKEAVRALVERGDQLLEALSGSRAGGDALATASEAVLSATADAVEAVIAAKARLAAVVLAPGMVVDPWASVDQECGYFPADLGRAALPDGNLLPKVEQGELPRLIPPSYRLAEALGLGSNRLQCEPRYIDPIQVDRPSWRGINVVARLYCELTGLFFVSSGANGDSQASSEPQATTSAEEPAARGGGDTTSPPEETFRIAVISRGRRAAGYNNTSAKFKTKKAYGVGEYPVSLGITDGRPSNPWVREVLPSAAARRGWRIEPVQSDSDAESAKSRVRDALREKLRLLKEEVAQALQSDAGVRDRLEVLQSRLNEYQSVIRTMTASGGNADGVPATVQAELGLQAVNLGGLVESGQLKVAVLRRVVRATGLALDAARRAEQVVNAPQAMRTQAAAVAESINSLARWTLR